MIEETQKPIEKTENLSIENLEKERENPSMENTALTEDDKLQILMNKNIEISTPLEVLEEDIVYDEIPSTIPIAKGQVFYWHDQYCSMLGYKKDSQQVIVHKHRGCDKFLLETTESEITTAIEQHHISLV